MDGETCADYVEGVRGADCGYAGAGAAEETPEGWKARAGRGFEVLNYVKSVHEARKKHSNGQNSTGGVLRSE